MLPKSLSHISAEKTMGKEGMENEKNSQSRIISIIESK